MSISRAFTTKRPKKLSDVDLTVSVPQRSFTTKQTTPGTIRQKKISGPVELISTTNMLSYNAPDIYPRTRSNTSSSSISNSDSRSASSGSSLTSPASSLGTPLTSPEASSIESSPTTYFSPTTHFSPNTYASPSEFMPQPNHLSCYFNQGVVSDDEAPTIPTRAVSHTKKSAEYIARKKSLSGMSSTKSTISAKSSISRTASTARSSVNMFSPNFDVTDHPFGNELAQVSELVEEYSASKEQLPVVDEEEQELILKGLFKFAAEDYMSELQGLFASVFGETPQVPAPAMWI